MQLLRAVGAQLIGLAFLAVVARFVTWPAWAGTGAVVQALGAAAAGHFVMRQPRWWITIHLTFMPAVYGVSQLEVGGGIWLGGLLVLALVFWGTVKGDVPLYLSSDAVTQAVGDLLAARPDGGRVADLGAGVGTVAAPLARRFPALGFDAWERAPLPYLVCRLRGRGLANLAVRRQDLWTADLSAYDVVFAFLSPAVMERLSAKVRAEMRPGTLFISAAFACPDWPADEEHVLDDRRGTHLYVHRLA